MIRNIIYLTCLTFLVSCSQFTAIKDFKTQSTLNRVVIKNQQVVPIRPYGSSSDFKTTLPQFKNIASIMAPQSASSTGDVQATAVAIQGDYAYVSYNMIGDEVFGAIDIINISQAELPVIEYSFSTDQYEFSDLRVKGNYLYLSGLERETKDHQSGAIVMIIDISNPAVPVTKDIKVIPGIYATSIDLLDNTVLVNTGTTGGTYKYDISNPASLVLKSSVVKNNGLYALTSKSFDLDLSGNSETDFEALSNSDQHLYSLNIAETKSLTPSRFIRKNALVYLNSTQSKSLHVLDLSPLISSTAMSQMSKITLPGTSNGITRDDQDLYLAQGEKGFFVVNVDNPSSPEILGSFDFQGDDGSGNNVWVTRRDNLRYLFLADGRQGLRILTEEVTTSPGSNLINFFAHGTTVGGIQSQIVIRVNGTDFQVVSLDDSYKLYSIPYSRILTSSDKVEIIYVNPTLDVGSTRPAFISYVEVNGKYCYQTPTPTSDDYGLLKNLQAISVSTTCDSYVVTQVCNPGDLKVSAPNCSLPGNIVGKLTCNDSGLQYTCKPTSECSSGYSNIGGICIPQVCSAGLTKDCSDSQSTRVQTCNSTGTDYGACQLVSCKSGNVLVNGQCQPQVCQPLSSTSCSVSNGSGTKVCDALGLNYSSCVATSCDSTHYLDGNSNCAAQTCTPNSKADCSLLSLKGQKTCLPNGSAYGTCNITGSNLCDSGYFYESGICIPQVCSPASTQSCQVLNGSGIKACSADGSSYGACTTLTCNSGFYKDGSLCVAQTCSPLSTNSCTLDHQLGVQTCNVLGSGKSSCVTGGICESGYYNNGSGCVIQACSPSSNQTCSTSNGTGVQTCSATGSGFGPCTTTQCNAGFTLIAGQCVAQTCSPGVQSSCSVGHVIGTQTCSSDGLTNGACLPGNSCEAGYYKSGVVCLPQACDPSSTAISCNEGNGIGSKSCLSDGSGYSSCQISACNSGFNKVVTSSDEWTFCSNEHEKCEFTGIAEVRYGKNGTFISKTITNGSDCENNVYTDPLVGTVKECDVHGTFSCVAQTCSPNSTTTCSVSNGQGVKTCDATGSSYGTCSVSTCASGFSLVGGSCVAQTCSPNSSVSCTDNHLTGTRTCSADGTSLSNCQTTSTCEAGYYNDNGTCKIQACLPGLAASCQVANGQGTEVCNTTGSGYNSCTTVSCSVGFYQLGQTCLPQACSPNTVSSCSQNHLLGTKLCNSQGSGYDSCLTGSTCESGYSNVNGTCQAQTCTPNSSTSCSTSNGTGSKICSASGLDYGSCLTSSCNSGFSLVGGSCVAQTCTPLSTRSCQSGNGQGQQTCDSTGMNLGSCQVTSCNAGFSMINGQCVSQVCTPLSAQTCSQNHVIGSQTCNATGTQMGSCQLGLTCEAGYYYSNGSCVSQVCSPGASNSCQVANGQGSQTCNASGSAYGTCGVTSCQSDAVKIGNACVHNLCPVSSGMGLNTAENSPITSRLVGADNDSVGTLSYSIVNQPTQGVISNFNSTTGTFTYTPNSGSGGNQTFTYKTNDSYCDSSVSTVNISVQCSQGSQLQNGQCLPQYNCQPNSKTSCSVTNGEGVQTCNASGSAYGSCVVSTCSQGTHLENGSCLTDSKTCQALNGTGTQAWNGTTYSNCVITQCSVNYSLVNNSCVQNVCSPNATTSCTDGVGSGQKTCKSDGSAYGSCSVTTCQSGYYLSSGTCKPLVCTPSSTRACSVTVLGFLKLAVGNQTCNQDGLSWGTCQLHTCPEGCGLKNNSCQKLTCTPGTSKACSVSNGQGVSYCSGSGDSWGTCQVTKCNEKCHARSNACERD